MEGQIMRHEGTVTGRVGNVTDQPDLADYPAWLRLLANDKITKRSRRAAVRGAVQHLDDRACKAEWAAGYEAGYAKSRQDESREQSESNE